MAKTVSCDRQVSLPLDEPDQAVHSFVGRDKLEFVHTTVEEAIRAGEDPLGDAFIASRSAEVRRAIGAVYTPHEIVAEMIEWAKKAGSPERIVDPGAGSGRFIMAAARAFPNAELVAVEVDPVAVEILRANLVACRLEGRARIVATDYREATLPHIEGQTLFIGNPPYVRHHDIEPKWKAWFTQVAGIYGERASQLAGLHLYFFLQTLQLAKAGDLGAFITSAEWLDVNYGSVLRNLLSRDLGGTSLHIIDPKAMPFPGTNTTGAVTCFSVAQRPKTLRVQAVASLGELNALSEGQDVPWEEAVKLKRWSTIIRPSAKPSSDHIELGELCRVHRGQVTGNNQVWIAGDQATYLPDEFLIPSVTKARELINTVDALRDPTPLRRVIDLPADLEGIDPGYLPAIDRFLNWAKKRGADQSYTARHRRAWWEVRLKEPAPIICTYMARRPPAFVRNLCAARHINVAHGLYPVQEMSDRALDALTAYLRSNVSTDSGRTYAGGLTKFEPRELERVHIPTLEVLQRT